MPITEAELETLRKSRNEQEWNAACDEIKRVRGGHYPEDWLFRVMLSGFMRDQVTSWR